jgi:hypothetical protein
MTTVRLGNLPGLDNLEFVQEPAPAAAAGRVGGFGSNSGELA